MKCSDGDSDCMEMLLEENDEFSRFRITEEGYMEAARSEESSGAFSMELNSFIFSFCIQDLSNISSLIGCIR